MFTAGHLPEAARATNVDVVFTLETIDGHLPSGNRQVFILNQHAANILNRLDAAHGGRLSALLNGTATVDPDYDGDMWPTIRDTAVKLAGFVNRFTPAHKAPAFTGEPPKIDHHVLSEAHRRIGEMGLQGDALRRGLEYVVSSLWQTHRPKPVDPVLIALEKVDLQALCEVARLNAVIEEMTKRHEEISRKNENEREDLWSEKERLKGEVERLEAKVKHLKSCSDTATGHAVKCAEERGEMRQEIERLQSKDRDADIAFKHMNDQIARLTKERDEARAEALEATRAADRQTDEVMWLEKVERENDEALRARAAKHYEVCDELDALKAHAAKLEAMLTARNGVKFWQDFQILSGSVWRDGVFDGVWVKFFNSDGLTNQGQCAHFLSTRQTPAPEAAPPVRWSYPVTPHSAVFVTTNDPCLLSDLPEEIRGVAWEYRDDGKA